MNAEKDAIGSVKPTLEVTQQVTDLQASMNDFWCVLEELEKRLQSVLKLPDPVKTTDDKDDEASALVPLADDLRNEVILVNKCAGRIRSILARLQI